MSSLADSYQNRRQVSCNYQDVLVLLLARGFCWTSVLQARVVADVFTLIVSFYQCLNPQRPYRAADQTAGLISQAAEPLVLLPVQKLVIVPWLMATVSLLGCKQMFVFTPWALHMWCINSLLHVGVSQGSPSRIQVLLGQMHPQCAVPHHPFDHGDLPPLPNGSQWRRHAANQHEGYQRAWKRQQGKVEWRIVNSHQECDMTK